MNNTDFVLKKLAERIDKLSRRTKLQQKLAYSFKIAITLLAFAATVLLGLSIKDDNYVQLSRNIAFVIGAAITAISTMESFWDIQRYWITNKIILSRLKELQDEYMFLDEKVGGITSHERQVIFDKYLSILRRKNEYWEEALGKERGSQILEKERDGSKNTLVASSGGDTQPNN